MNETKPKKMVSRDIALTLGIICIILIALIAYFTATGISAQNSYNNLQNQNEQLQTWLAGNETLLNQTRASNTNLQKQVDSLNSNMTTLQDQVNNFTHIVNLDESTVWVDGGIVNIMGNPPTYEENASFAGYVSVQVSSQYNVTVEVSYLSHGASYENSTIVGKSGTATFPVLPSSNISFYIFQTWPIFVLSGPLYATVTITYYY
jgi:cell division protein FtsB